MPHETLAGKKGIQERPARAKYLIKPAHVCSNCTNSYRATETTGTGYAERKQSVLVCNLFNCRVDKTEWCKNHKK